MNEFIIELQAKLDEAKSKENVNDDIDKLQTQLDKLKIKAEIDPKTISNLTKQLENIIGQKIVISNIGVDQNNITKAAQQTGKQIVNSINKEIESAGTVTNKILRDFSELNNAKRKFVDDHDLISKEEISDAERFYSTIKQAFSEFGQVTVTKGSLEDGTLESMRVKIQQVNGELKTTRDFMLYLNKNDDFGNGFKLVDDDTIRTSEKLIQHLNEEKNIINATGDEIEAQKQKLAEQEKYYKNIKNEVNNLYNLKTKLLSANELQTAELEKQIKQTKERISYNNKQIDKKDLRDNSLDRQINDLEVAKQKQLDLASAKSQDVVNTKELAQAEREAIAALKKRQTIEAQVNKIQLSIDNGKGASEYQNRINSIIASLEKYGVETKEAQTITASLQSTFDSMKGMSGQELITQADKLEQEFKAVKVSVDEAKLAYDKFAQPASDEKISSLITKIQKFLEKNTNITKEAQVQLSNYIQELSGGNISLSRWNAINAELKKTESTMSVLGKLGKSFSDQIKDVGRNVSTYLSASSLFMNLFSKTKDSILELKEINNILTEISKTSDLTTQELEKLGNTSFNSASKHGKNASDFLLGIQEMSRSGFYGEKGSAMAEQSLLAQAAGDMTADVANKYILATNAAYKYNGEAEKLNAVLDGQNSITNRNSVGLEDMAVAMSEAGTVASSYRVSIEDLSAMIGTMEAVTKAGGSEVGNSLKSILINLQNVTSDKIVSTLNQANASMTEFVNGTERLRNPIEILRDLSATFNQLDENDTLRAEILTNIGGKHQAAKLAALLQNMEMFDKMLVDYSEGSGSAMEEAMKSANNWEGSLNKLNNTWTKIVNNFVNSNAIITATNSFNSFLSVIDTATSKLGSLGTIGLGAGLFSSIKNVGMA